MMHQCLFFYRGPELYSDIKFKLMPKWYKCVYAGGEGEVC